MGLILDSSVLIAAERGAQPVAMLLRTIKAATGPTEVMISAISVIAAIELSGGAGEKHTT